MAKPNIGPMLHYELKEQTNKNSPSNVTLNDIARLNDHREASNDNRNYFHCWCLLLFVPNIHLILIFFIIFFRKQISSVLSYYHLKSNIRVTVITIIRHLLPYVLHCVMSVVFFLLVCWLCLLHWDILYIQCVYIQYLDRLHVYVSTV